MIIAFIGAWALSAGTAWAQYKGPRDYFPKNRPVPGVTNGSQPGANNNGQASVRTAPGQQTAKPQQPKFKDLPVNSRFYFLADTNRAFTWVKISSTTATNTKNGVVQAISGDAVIQK